MLETLEPRLLFSADAATLSSDLHEDYGVEVPAIMVAAQADAAAAGSAAQAQTFQLNLPSGLPETLTVTIPFSGEQLTLELDKNSVFGENTKFLVDDGSGELVEIERGLDRSYLGTVAENPNYVVTAWVSEEGLIANIIRPGQASLVISPAQTEAGSGTHTIVLGESINNPLAHDHDGDGIPDHAPENHPKDTDGNGHPPSCSCSACCGLNETLNDDTAASVGPVATTPLDTFETVNVSNATATLPPTRVMDVYEYEIGVEIGSAAFLNNYSGSLAQVQSVVAGIPGNLDARFLHSTGIKFRLGTVIIRQSTGEDPFTVSNGNDSGGLSAFRSYWNNNPQEVGNTHDLAVYHVRGNPSGLAYVNNVGTSSRYLLSASNGPTSWADGTLAHEVGHQWNLNHVPSNPDSSFYESKPRSNGNAAGGSDQFVSIMHGSGTHNIGRVSTGEANRAFAARQNKLGFGDLVTNFGEVKPFGHLDEVSVVGESPIVIDVIANDYDVNNDVLNVQLRDTVSQQGATISLSVGTGPGGRDQIIYTPAAGQQTGTDFFHYNVVDSTGRSDWGAVYVDYQGATTVDLNQTVYRYDLGPENSVVFPAYELISDATFGDLGFTMPGNPGNFVVESRDRGAASGVNNLNRDHIRLRAEADFHHKLADGIYDVLFTVGDRLENSNPIILTAEGSVSLTTVNHGPADFTNYTLQDVTVTDGELNVDIVNQGFTSNITRIVITRVGDAPSVVDTGLTSYDYDFGTPTSPVPSGWVGITPDTYGDISWSGATPLRLDRGSIPGVNDINRDFVYGPGASTLNHKLADGVWRVVLNMGDASFAHDQMGVRAEGQLITNSVTSFAGQFLYVDENGGSATPTSFDVVVSDGELNLEFSDNGGIDANWVLNRLSLDRIGDVPAPASIVGRHIFYNNSSFDSNNPAANAQDDSAIATDKTALLPGQNAAFTNYTSYSNGINGVMIDVADLASASLSASDFVFKAGNNDDPSSWATAPTPTSITIRGGAGAGGSDRVTLVWPDSVIKNQWLEVTVKANSQTGLTQDDIFYFGNAIGETGNSTTGTVVNISDMLGVRSNPHNLGNPAGVADAYDFNRDRQVNISDMLIARSNATNLSNDLELITVPDQPLATASIASLEASPTSTIIQNYDALAALAYQQLMDQNNGTSIGEEDEDETQEEVLNPSEQLLDQPGI